MRRRHPQRHAGAFHDAEPLGPCGGGHGDDEQHDHGEDAAAQEHLNPECTIFLMVEEGGK